MNTDLTMIEHAAQMVELGFKAGQRAASAAPAAHSYDDDDLLHLMVGGRPALKNTIHSSTTVWFDLEHDCLKQFADVRAIDFVVGATTVRVMFKDLTADCQIRCEEAVQSYLDDGYDGL